jgi:hypothetical protein
MWAVNPSRKAFPSHGRGRRFNPYSAHQGQLPKSLRFFQTWQTAFDVPMQNDAQTCALLPGKIRGI